MRAIVWSDDALRDFDSAVFYIAQDSRHAALLVAERIEAAIDLLSEMPIGHRGRVKGTHEKRVLKTPYIVAYALLEDSIVVLRVIHGSRDWPEDSWPDDDA